MNATRRILVGAIAAISLVAGGVGARAEHALAATHVAPPVVEAQRDLDLHVPVASSCPVAPVCGWIGATVHFYSAIDGDTTAEAWVPYQAATVVVVSVPGRHINGCCYGMGTFAYWIEVRQRHCSATCHEGTVRLPSTGWYRSSVVG